MLFATLFAFMIITSKSNKLVKYVSSLKQKKARKENGVYIVEGVKMISEAIVAKKEIKLLHFAKTYDTICFA